MTTTDRTTEPAGVFDAHLARWEAAEADPDGTVERVARAMWESERIDVCGRDRCCTWESIDDERRASYRRLAAAAIDALRPAPAGRCGHESPSIAGGTPSNCALPAGHAGWHRGDRDEHGNATEWGRPAPDAPRDARLTAVLDLADELEREWKREVCAEAFAIRDAASRIRSAVAAPLAGHDNEAAGGEGE
jgi:hypothetical protein